MAEAHCSCGRRFQVDDSLVGGLANCAACGRAAPVAGLRDPFWRVLQAAAVVAWIGLVSFALVQGGLGAAIAVGIVLAALGWLVSRAF